MEDKNFLIYKERYIYLGGRILDDCLRIDSEIYGEIDSEKHYEFSKEDTELLFQKISLEDFIVLCQIEHVRGMEEYLDSIDIHPSVWVF